MRHYLITNNVTEETLGEMEEVGAAFGLSPEEVTEMALKLGLKALIAWDNTPQYDPTDYGEGAVRVGDVEVSLPQMIKQMKENAKRDEHIGRVGLIKWFLYNTTKNSPLFRFTSRWS